MVRGSSAMPQIGQVPGSKRTIWGCIGHVYSVRVSVAGVSRSNAIPQLGLGPGFVCRTSEHIGQTYATSLEGGDMGVSAGTAGFGDPSVTSGAADLGFKYSSG